MGTGNDRPRDGNGRYYRTVEDAERDERAARLRADGWTFARIAEELGYDSRATAHHAVQRVLKETVREAGEDLRSLELERLDKLYRSAMGVLERQHVTVSHGKIIQAPDPDTGEETPLIDDAPVLNAIDRLLRIQERRARLLGLDAPVKRDISLTDERAAAIEALVEELGE
jgi:hypothetical protein